ncbi:tetratricopeptide repeat protein [Streptomyces zaomyceticus]|uniref:tetratricopeptide repeat protein n=1 Tax=Streptomyces zaomyceticus TaxID=68286 RepID=UPI0036542957
MRESHRAEVERLLERVAAEEAPGSGGRAGAEELLARGLASLDSVAAGAAGEYAVYLRAVEEAEAGPRPAAGLRGGATTGGPALVAGVAAVAAVGADLALGTTTGTALGAGAVVAVAGAAVTVLRATSGRGALAGAGGAGAVEPGGTAAVAPGGGGPAARVEEARLRWLAALETRGVRPFLARERTVPGGSGGEERARVGREEPAPLPGADRAGARTGGPLGTLGGAPALRPERLRGADRSAEARRRAVLERSFGQLPHPGGNFAGRREELARITRWVQTGRASAATRPTVVLLHGEPGSGRTALAVRAAHALRDQFRGACVVDLRGDVTAGPGTDGERPLATREALLHLLNRLGAPRERLLFREGSTADQQVRRLMELYQRQLTGVPVTVILDDAVDPAQVRALLPERSDSLVLVTCREPLDLGADLPADVHALPVAALDAAGAEELLRAASGPASGVSGPDPYDAEAFDRIRELCGGLPLALRATGSLLGSHSMGQLAQRLARPDRGSGPVERALSLRYFTDLDEDSRRLFRRLSLAGRASLGAAAATALLGRNAPLGEGGPGGDGPGGGEFGGDGPYSAVLLRRLAGAGLLDHVRGERYRLHDAVRGFAAARLLDEEDAAEITAAQERLIRNYAELADAVIRMVDGKMSTRADRFDGHGFGSLEAALSWLDEESSFITAALRHVAGVDQQTVLDLLGALCDYCLLRGDLYRLGEINELAESVGQGRLSRSVQWRTGIAARQIGELDKARTTLTSVVSLYQEAHQDAGAALALCSLGITLHHQGRLTEAAARLREALALQEPEALAADRGWTLHALAAVERDRANLAEAATLLDRSLALHREHESPHGEAWAHFHRGQVLLLRGDVAGAEADLRAALDGYGRIHDGRGEAWALTQLARARLAAGDAEPAVEGLRGALARHRERGDARGEAWTLYHLGHALEERGDRDEAVRELGRARTMFSRMRDVQGLAGARHHSGRVTRDQLAARTGGLRNSGFARQLLVDARADFHRIGVAHGEAWTCLELAIIDAGNARVPQALGLCDEARALFGGYGDRRGADWARFLRCTLLPHAVPGAPEPGTATAREELAALVADRHPARDPRLDDCAEAYAVLLDRGVHPSTAWQAWDLGMVPNRHAREVLGVPVE